MHEITAIIADDEELSRAHLETQLLKVWPDLVISGEAENGLEAVEMIEDHQPDVAFLDIRMPGLSGIEVAKNSSTVWKFIRSAEIIPISSGRCKLRFRIISFNIPIFFPSLVPKSCNYFPFHPCIFLFVSKKLKLYEFELKMVVIMGETQKIRDKQIARRHSWKQTKQARPQK